jgi:hypothetical protein
LLVLLALVTACQPSPQLDVDQLVAESQQAWASDWHVVWQIEWKGAPVRGPLVAEIWHAADGRLRIETLEAPTAALSGLTLVDDGTTIWFQDSRQNQVQTGTEELRIPLASDTLDAIGWLLHEMENGTVTVTGQGELESGPATRLNVALPDGDRVILWVDDETGLPARVELNSLVWGEAVFTARSIDAEEPLHPGLFIAE